jgi:membrane-anchored mycosin MYCP
MGSRVGTARRGSVKISAVVLAALFGVFSPGYGPLTAAAQDDGQPRAPWEPVGEPGSPPDDTGQPDKVYIEEVQCITTSTKGHENVAANAMKEAPPAQRQLRLDDVHNYVRLHSKSGKIGADKNTGKPFRVAVIDTGVTPHVFFGGRVKPGGDYVQNGGNGLEDCDGHGTQVAGIIGANPQAVDHRIAFTGVAPDVEIFSIRQSSQNFRPETPEEKEAKAEERKRAQEAREAQQKAEELAQKAEDLEKEQQELERRQQEDEKKDDTDSSSVRQGGQDPRAQGAGAGNLGTLAEAVMRAVDKHKVDVINMSVDACRPNTGDYRAQGDEAKLRAAIRHAVEKKVVVVAAAGNEGGSCVQNDKPEQTQQPGQPQQAQAPGTVPDPNDPPTIVSPPWFSEDLLAVAAVDDSGGVADFSMRGPWVSVAAPGTGIISLDPAKGSELLVNVTFDGESGQQPLRGTSFAAPYVAGLAVLVKQMHPELDARQIMDRIKRTAQHPGARDGHDQYVGYGMIDPMAALTATFPDEIGVPEAQDRKLGSDVPPLVIEDNTPMIVALAGTGGALAALGITIFVVRTARRRNGNPSTEATS